MKDQDTKQFFEKLGWEKCDCTDSKRYPHWYKDSGHAIPNHIICKDADQIAQEVQRMVIEARIAELKTLTEWKVGATGDDDYDIVYAHHKRAYHDRVTNLEQQLKELEQE